MKQQNYLDNIPDGGVPVLDYGFVSLVDVMGDDAAVVQAARVSYGKGTKTKRDDEGLINYLYRNRHTTPFEMVQFKFLVRMPIFVARQWIRHRTASVNEYSGRYSEMTHQMYLPPLERIQGQGVSNKQGSSGVELEDSRSAQRMIEDAADHAWKTYKDLLTLGVAKELARVVLPVSTYTEMYWKIDLHNLFHFLRLRLDSHAQDEIQDYANAIASLVKSVVPMCWEAFERYQMSVVDSEAIPETPTFNPNQK